MAFHKPRLFRLPESSSILMESESSSWIGISLFSKWLWGHAFPKTGTVLHSPDSRRPLWHLISKTGTLLQPPKSIADLSNSKRTPTATDLLYYTEGTERSIIHAFPKTETLLQLPEFMAILLDSKSCQSLRDSIFSTKQAFSKTSFLSPDQSRICWIPSTVQPNGQGSTQQQQGGNEETNPQNSSASSSTSSVQENKGIPLMKIYFYLHSIKIYIF